ncbi:hypothetical protein [Allorhodopirellula heiligendammensis]|uniref:hypothetical protein n=1 Tax=Allorhodopirellula heiligendammensis TaxID=2714739 RepID=UPI00265D7925|nr:hypothetical protein [Allorhodopirellula heiligendammensis]
MSHRYDGTATDRGKCDGGKQHSEAESFSHNINGRTLFSQLTAAVSSLPSLIDEVELARRLWLIAWFCHVLAESISFGVELIDELFCSVDESSVVYGRKPYRYPIRKLVNEISVVTCVIGQ